jgi:Tol biopolymer transport system component
MRRFLKFTVEEKLAGRAASLKETLIGVHVFDRNPGYDPKIDAIVRVEARRSRNKLLEYAHSYPTERVYMELPKGSYVPEFRWAGAPPWEPAASQADRSSKFRKPWLRIVGFATAAIVIGLLARDIYRHVRPIYTAMEGRPLTTYPGYQTGPAFSPDGKRLAFCWHGPSPGPDALWIQPVDGDTPMRLTHSQAMESRPVWSPNGKQLAFLREGNTGRGSICLIDTSSARETKVGEMTDNGTPGRIDWSPDGRSLITSELKSSDGPSVITRLWLDTGREEQITAPPGNLPGDTEPAFSPSGRTIAFRRSTGVDVEDIYVVPTPSASRVSNNLLRRVTFDNRAIRGFAWSADGQSLIVASCRAGSLYSLWRIPVSSGVPTRLTEAGVSVILPAISRIGSRLAYVKVLADTNIWKMATAPGSAAQILIVSTLLDSSPQFAPDGNRIAFRSDRSGNNEVWMANADGSNQWQVTHFNGPLTGSPRWSPDGAYLALESRDAGNADIYILPVGGGTPRRFTTNTANDILPSWSTDGKSIYFASDRSGKWQVWKQDVAGGEARQITKSGGFMAFESHDARFLFFYRHHPEPAIWRLSLATREETLVVPLKWHEMWGNWAVGKRGLFFLDYDKAADPPVAAIKFYDFLTGRIDQLGWTSRKPTTWKTGLALSPDERWLLFSQVDGAGSNIMLAENFR